MSYVTATHPNDVMFSYVLLYVKATILVRYYIDLHD